ncbi:mediator of RNA polymerase II transcription subunit 4-like [Panonychus citri]|uniref:mediator of RNA polymerase II transcription subunit 4-like n=1 Tax=Panonychus citri TaxID=50023 RepID=UPI0023072B30|nr:mediator of RNA polymerase II transcription subunit 4-like [Panonychus citri]
MTVNQYIKDVILGCINDMESLSKSLIENMINNKRLRPNSGHTVNLTELGDNLVAKNGQLKKSIKTAMEMEEMSKKVDYLNLDINRADEEIKHLTKSLKEAEHILATAIYQAKQKLSLIRQANEHPVPSEELIKYAYKISSCHSVAAPYNWEQGDLRRPYPTDSEMRSGWIGQMGGFVSNMVTSGQPQSQPQQQNSYNAQTAPNSTAPLAEDHLFTKGFLESVHSSSIDSKATISKDNLDEVEVMSTDSSSSSSSDSQ